jgi:hypothetical protein
METYSRLLEVVKCYIFCYKAVDSCVKISMLYSLKI